MSIKTPNTQAWKFSNRITIPRCVWVKGLTIRICYQDWLLGKSVAEIFASILVSMQNVKSLEWTRWLPPLRIYTVSHPFSFSLGRQTGENIIKIQQGKKKEGKIKQQVQCICAQHMSIVEADQIPAYLPTASASCSIPGRAEDSGREHCDCSSMPTISHRSTTSKAVIRNGFLKEEKECFPSILFHWEKQINMYSFKALEAIPISGNFC